MSDMIELNHNHKYVISDIAMHLNYSGLAVLYIILELTRNTFYGMCTCPMHDVSKPIIQTTTVQGHPGSKFIVPIKSPLMVCYLTAFKSNIVSVTIFETFAAKKSLA